jgi:hypothetical protein
LCSSFGGTYSSPNDTCTLQGFADATENHYVVSSTKYVNDFFVDKDLDNSLVNTTGDTVTGTLTVNGKTEANAHCIGGNCRTTFADQDCGPDKLIRKINSDGSAGCVSITCSSGQYFAGFDSSGNSICSPIPTTTCSTNQYVSEVKSDGTVVCSPLPAKVNITCGSDQYIRSIDANNNPTCVDDIKDTTCTTNNYINRVSNNQPFCSCRAFCPSASTICKGDTFTGDDGCGSSCNVVGTKTDGWCYPDIITNKLQIEEAPEGYYEMCNSSGQFPLIHSCSVQNLGGDAQSFTTYLNHGCRLSNSGDSSDGYILLTAECKRN